MNKLLLLLFISISTAGFSQEPNEKKERIKTEQAVYKDKNGAYYVIITSKSGKTFRRYLRGGKKT